MHGPVAALCACALAGCLLPAAASAAPDPEAQATLDRSVRFLQEAQNVDGGFGGKRGGLSDPGFSAWAAYALAAASINPQDQAQPGGVDVFTYLTGHTDELEETTDFDRVALVALASGTSPYSFGSVDPIDTILSRQLPDGSFPQQAGGESGWVNATVWSIFPLSAIGSPATDAAVQRAASWLIDQQGEDGSWGWGPASAPSPADTDTTGAAIEALNAAGLHGTEAERRAFEFLETMQGPDGGFRAAKGSPTNSATTAWVIQGMWSAGVDPRAWRTEGGTDPLGFLASLQQPDGSIKWTATDDLNSLWMTAQVGPALAGRTYPLPAVPRKVKAPPPPAPEAPQSQGHRSTAAHRGHGGTGVVRGDGVIAGGGGRGAPLFSAPQPQSGGSTPRGSRQLEATAAQASAAPPSPRAADEEGAASGDGASATATGRHGGGGDTVEGVLVGARQSRPPAAPGLFGADSGGEPETRLVLALAGALLAAATIGARRERAGARTT